MSSPSVRRAFGAVLLGLSLLIGQAATSFSPSINTVQAGDGCYKIAKSSNSPTGIAGCVRFGKGRASHYGPGYGVAMNFCTWTYRHKHGCGKVVITSLQTGRQVTVPVVDYCDCYTGTDDERMVDLQWGVLAKLGLSRGQGIYQVTVYPLGYVKPKPKAEFQPTPLPSPTGVLSEPVFLFSAAGIHDGHNASAPLPTHVAPLSTSAVTSRNCDAPPWPWDGVEASDWTVLATCDYL